MSEADDDADVAASADVGLTLLLGGGVAEAMASIEATLRTVQGAAARMLAGLSRVQAVGAAASSVPPAPRTEQPPEAPIEAPIDSAVRVRPADRFAPPPVAQPAGPEQVAAFAPDSAPDGGMAPVPLPLAGQAPEPSMPAAPTPFVEPAMTSAMAPPVTAAPVLFASFAPAAPTPSTEAPAGGANGTAAPQPAGPWGASAPERVQHEWVGPVAPIAESAGGNGAEPRASAQSASPAGRSGPTGGDVFLDGVRVGTWLADHLAHEVGRPQVGGTLFDPRLTPAWPGTLQGS